MAAISVTLGVVVAVSGLTVTDTSGDLGLAPLLGLMLVPAALAGIASTALLWRRR